MLLPACGAAARAVQIPAAGDASGAKRILILTGEDYAGHDWRSTAPALESLIEADSRLLVDVFDDLKSLSDKSLSPYAAVVVHFKNYDPAIPGRAAFDRLRDFVHDGGGLVLVHFACGAFEEFRDDYEDLVGRVWFGATPPAGRAQHDPHGPFTVNLTDVDHPVTKGLTSFSTTDELYTCLEGDAPIQVLAEAVSARDGATYPMAFVTEVGKGRVFHCVLGHDVAALTNEPVARLYCRAAAWAAGLEPAPDAQEHAWTFVNMPDSTPTPSTPPLSASRRRWSGGAPRSESWESRRIEQ